MASSQAPDIVRSAYAELVVTDLGASKHFWVDRLGFVISAEDDSTVYLRGHEEFVHHSLILRKGTEPACSRFAFGSAPGGPRPCRRVPHRPWLRGTPVSGGHDRAVGPTVRVQDPFGFVVEYFHDIEWTGHHHQRYDLRHAPSINRLDHINLVTDDVRAFYEWYTARLRTLGDHRGRRRHAVRDVDVRKQTVHDIASTQGSSPRLHHIAFACPKHTTSSPCRHARCHERVPSHRARTRRHGVSNAFYLYLRDPDGHRVELYTTDYFTGDPGHQPLRWSVNDQRRRDFWANPVVPRWYEEASRVLDLDGNLQPIRERKSDEQRITVGADGTA